MDRTLQECKLKNQLIKLSTNTVVNGHTKALENFAGVLVAQAGAGAAAFVSLDESLKGWRCTMAVTGVTNYSQPQLLRQSSAFKAGGRNLVDKLGWTLTTPAGH